MNSIEAFLVAIFDKQPVEIFYEITRKNVLGALSRIKGIGVPKKAQSTRYGLIHKNEIFPPKVVLAVAYKVGIGIYLDKMSFSGGRPTDNILKRLGFSVVRKLKHRAKFTDGDTKELREKAKAYARSPKISELTKRLIKMIRRRS